jgi:hypothetical protein
VQHGVSTAVGARREGVVVSLAEPSESFVIGKLSRKLRVTIPELQLKDGVLEPIGASAPQESTGP